MASRLKGRFAKATEIDRRKVASLNISNHNRCTRNVEGQEIPEDKTFQPGIWNLGERRVFEPAEVHRRLSQGCEMCGVELKFTRIVSETVCGLGSMIYISCDCGMLNKLNTGKVHYSQGKNKTRPIFDINTKVAIAMYDTGMGPHQVNRFLTDINLPGICQTSLKKREREVCEPIKEVAKKALDEALEEEKAAVVSHSVLPSGDNIPLSVKYDMGWQKRGSGRKYNSKSGVGSMIGHETGKLLDVDVRSSDCRVCTYWGDKEIDTPPHNCTRNWFGTAKAMEPDVGLHLLQNIETKGCTVANIIMDDDTTTMARIRGKIDHPIEKWSDLGHTNVQLGNRLYKLREKYKKDFTPDHIAHIQRLFMYAIKSHKDNSEAISEAITSIVPHVFGSHELCNETWCGYLKNPNSYKPTVLLLNECLKTDLQLIFENYMEEKNVRKLAPCGSTKDNESFNNMVAHKAPKNKHYCSSESLESRVMCAAAQKNMSFDYVSEVNVQCGLSPGKYTYRMSNRLSRKRKQQSDFKSSKEFKRKKLSKTKKLKIEQTVGEIREGVTYQTGVDILPSSSADIETISVPTIPPCLEKVSIDPDSYTLVFFDLETSSLAMNCDILQVAACYGNVIFNQYVTPTQHIDKRASEVTGLTVSSNFLCYNGRKVDSCLPQQAMQKLICWINEVPTQNIVLVGHNCKKFDMPRLLNTLHRYNLVGSFEEKVRGFVDTLTLFREKYPHLKSHKQEVLAKTILKRPYNAHNAEDDVNILQQLLNAANISHRDIIQHSFSTSSSNNVCKHARSTAVRLLTLKRLQDGKVATPVMVKRIADSGLDLKQLILAYRRDNDAGIHGVLSEKRSDGHVRVTARKCITLKISNFIAKLSEDIN